MSVFNKEYAAYYDMLYKNKNYDVEADYVSNLLNETGIKGNELLDIGCGTGKHLACMRTKGFSVNGVDMSQNMIEKARIALGNDVELQVAEAGSFSFSKKFSVITSLFHVMSYLTNTDDVVSAFKNVSVHLNRGGLFVFDFWHGAGCLTDFPKTKILRLEDDNCSLMRITEPVMHPERNVIDVNFEVHLTDKKTDKHSVIHETHNMRYFFLPELEYYLQQADLKVLKSYKWLTKQALDFDSWYGVIVAAKG